MAIRRGTFPQGEVPKTIRAIRPGPSPRIHSVRAGRTEKGRGLSSRIGSRNLPSDFALVNPLVHEGIVAAEFRHTDGARFGTLQHVFFNGERWVGRVTSEIANRVHARAGSISGIDLPGVRLGKVTVAISHLKRNFLGIQNEGHFFNSIAFQPSVHAFTVVLLRGSERSLRD